jgi:hypothetical protein
MHAVPDHARAVVLRMAREQDRARHAFAELTDCRFLELDLGATERDAAYAGVRVGCHWRFSLATGQQRDRGGNAGCKCAAAKLTSVHVRLPFLLVFQATEA